MAQTRKQQTVPRELLFHLAAKQGNIPACRVLLKAGASPTSVDILNRTPISAAKNAATRALLQTYLPHPPMAEKYIKFSMKEYSNDVLLLDAHSPKSNPGNGSVEFKYRTVSSDSLFGSGKTTLEYTAIAWCRKMTMWILRVDGVYPGYQSLLEEYYIIGKGLGT